MRKKVSEKSVLKKLKKLILLNFTFVIIQMACYCFALADTKNNVNIDIAELNDYNSEYINDNNQQDSYVSATDIEIAAYADILYVGKTQTVTANVLPSESNDTIMYSSSNPEVLVINSSGEMKAVAKGDAVVYVKAGDCVKELNIACAIQTTEIDLSSDYIILKVDEQCNLSAKVYPAEANQDVTYSSSDASIAEVSASGIITAKGIGNTTIIAKNSDYITSATVIVNKGYNNVEVTEVLDNITSDNSNNVNSDITIENALITSNQLKELYNSKQKLIVEETNCTITVDGNKIINYNNELKTDINLQQVNDGYEFIINDHEPLCGEIYLTLKEKCGKYVYLYNPSKEKYELINANGNEQLSITTAGRYYISDSKLSMSWEWIIYALVVLVIVIVIGSVAYIFVKKRFWFW